MPTLGNATSIHRRVSVDRTRSFAVATFSEAMAPGVPMIGCTSSGVVERNGSFGAALQLIVLGGAGFDARTALGDYGALGSRGAGRLVGQAVPPHADGVNRALLLLSDDLAMAQTCQFAGPHQLESGVAAAALSSTGPIGIGVEHGWTPVGEPMVVTDSEGTSIVALDDRPAMDMSLEAVGRDRSIIDSAGFARFALTRPLGLTDNRAGHIRFVTGGDLDRRTLEFLVHVPAGSLVWVMEGSRESVVDAARAAGRQAVSKLDRLDPIGVVAFDCVARRSVIGDALVFEETFALSSTLPEDTPMGGFYTYGEIASTGGSLGLHHQTMVVLALG